MRLVSQSITQAEINTVIDDVSGSMFSIGTGSFSSLGGFKRISQSYAAGTPTRGAMWHLIPNDGTANRPGAMRFFMGTSLGSSFISMEETNSIVR